MKGDEGDEGDGENGMNVEYIPLPLYYIQPLSSLFLACARNGSTVDSLKVMSPIQYVSTRLLSRNLRLK
jgi:hypothetical protein